MNVSDELMAEIQEVLVRDRELIKAMSKCVKKYAEIIKILRKLDDHR